MLLFLVIPCLVVAFQPCMEWMPVKKNPTGDLPTQEDYSSPSLLWLYFHEKFFSFTLFFIFIWNLLKCNISCETKTSNFGTKMPYMRIWKTCRIWTQHPRIYLLRLVQDKNSSNLGPKTPCFGIFGLDLSKCKVSCKK